MGASREKDQADFDLDRFVDIFDEAMTSKDPRVMETLRSLMMIVTLTRPEARNVIEDRERGPLRRMFEELHHLNRRMRDIEDSIRSMQRDHDRKWPQPAAAMENFSMAAAAQMAQSIDADVMQSISRKINNGNAGLNLVPPKGLLKK